MYLNTRIGGFIMNEKVLKTLEYYKIIKMLENQAGSEPGKKLCHALVPSADIHTIKRKSETDR